MRLIDLIERRILGAAFLHAPSGFVTKPYSMHADAMYDEELRKAAGKPRMGEDRFVRYIMDRQSDDLEDAKHPEWPAEFIVGFVDDDGKFHDRDDAAAIARQDPGQPALNDRSGSDRLDSTDLHWRESTNMTEHDDQHHQAMIDTGYWGKAGAGCLIMARDTGRFLLPLRSQWVQEPGTWGTWGGAIDPGEDPAKACVREVEEEAGYHGKIDQMIHLYRYQDDEFRYDTFLAVIEREFEPVLNWESDTAQWIANGDWPNPLHFGLEEVLKDSGVQNKLGAASSS